MHIITKLFELFVGDGVRQAIGIATRVLGKLHKKRRAFPAFHISEQLVARDSRSKNTEIGGFSYSKQPIRAHTEDRTMSNALPAAQTLRVLKQETAGVLPPGHANYVEFSSSQDNSCLWTVLRVGAPPHVSPQLLNELAGIAAKIRQGRFGVPRYRVLASNLKGVFSLGGDLRLFLELMEAQDRNVLFEYAKAAIDEVWTNVTGFGIPGLVTVTLVEGEAQGGGFEAALACHVLVAEQGMHLGFPESLFGLFPGMGAAQLLEARTDADIATRLT